jgi:hypothetical protein
MRLEVSGEGSTGMSHREWGDRSQALAFLVETVNPAQDYAWLRPAEQLDHPSLPLWRRVGVILETLEALARAGAAASMAGGVRYQGLPSLSELEVYGLEPYF